MQPHEWVDYMLERLQSFGTQSELGHEEYSRRWRQMAATVISEVQAEALAVVGDEPFKHGRCVTVQRALTGDEIDMLIEMPSYLEQVTGSLTKMVYRALDSAVKRFKEEGVDQGIETPEPEPASPAPVPEKKEAWDLAGVMGAYPGGLEGLSEATGLSRPTLFRIGNGTHRNCPKVQLRQVHNALRAVELVLPEIGWDHSDWDQFVAQWKCNL